MKNNQWRWFWIIGLFLAACTPNPSETPERIETQNIVLTQESKGTPIPAQKLAILPLIFRGITLQPTMTQPPAPSWQSTSPFGSDTILPDFSATLEAELYSPPTQAAKQALAQLKGGIPQLHISCTYRINHLAQHLPRSSCLRPPLPEF